MLQQARLLGNLRQFCDEEDSSFRGFPPSREQARHEWAHAFFDYLTVIEEDILRPPPPPDSHASLDLSGAEDAFFAALGLNVTMSADDAAADFAGAWQQSILAISPTPAGVTNSASAIYKFVSFSNVTTLHDTLRATLAGLFAAPAATAATRPGDIATAFHTATAGLSASVTIQTGSPPPSPGTMGVR